MSDATHRKVRAQIEDSRTRTLMVRTARRILADDECEDAAHDAVVQALVSASKFREDAQVGTWLYRIAFNAALMKQRSARRASQRLLRVQREGNVLPVMGSVGISAPGALEEGELRQRLRTAVAQLPDVYRTVIERCVYDEQNAQIVAADLGITASALRTRIARARDRLRTLIDGSDGAQDRDEDGDHEESHLRQHADENETEQDNDGDQDEAELPRAA